MSESESGVSFSNMNTSAQDAMFSFARPPRLYYRGGSGVSIGDVTGDGLDDIYFVSNLGENKLYKNLGDFRFEDITKKAGVAGRPYSWSRGCVMIDINSDGALDIYVTSSVYAGQGEGRNALYINKGNGTFTERSEAYGLDDSEDSFQSSFFDYDRDGDLDLFLITHIEEKLGGKAFHSRDRIKDQCQKDKLYRNDGGKFVDVTLTSGIENCALALNVLTTDLNNDGWPDIFIQNDFVVPDRAYVNNQDGTFTEMSEELFMHYSFSSMGGDAADFNNDGRVDIFTLDMLPEDNLRQKIYSGMIIPRSYNRLAKEGLYWQNQRNCLFMNNGFGFSEIGQMAGVYKTDWSWGSVFADLDNDGFKDLVISNTGMFNALVLEYGLGSKVSKETFIEADLDTALSNYVFQNNGDLTFEKKMKDWGFDQKINSTGLAYGDLDNDGDLDMVFNNLNDPVSIYRNDSKGSGFVQFLLKKDKKAFDWGARITIYHNGTKQVQELLNNRGYLSSSSPVLHFGIGNASAIDSANVQWSDGTSSRYGKFRSNQKHSVIKKSSVKAEPIKTVALFETVDPGTIGLSFLHDENGFKDFRVETLLPHKLSINGPGMATGDLNNDLKDDVLFGGAFDQPTSLRVQTATGEFNEHQLDDLQKHANWEDLGMLLFDADGDRDLDLYAVGGGYKYEAYDNLYSDRLYLNGGNGDLKHATGKIPPMNESGSCAVAGDFDKDGDMDLFVGGRVLPRKYPLSPRSYLLVNEGGRFTDQTDSLAPGLVTPGLITAALWTDYDQDEDLDLLITGEWMAVRVFRNDSGRFTETTSSAGLAKHTGMWNSLTGGDFDNDGDVDYIVGNLGLNNKFDVSLDRPLHIYYNDFDGDSTGDIVLSYYVDNVNVPVRGRICSSAQMPLLKEQFGSSKEFASSGLLDIYDNQKLSDATQGTAAYLASSILLNNGDGTFKVQPLPKEAQVAPVYGLLIDDYNEDGYLDLLLTGNSYAPEVETGKYDAFTGLLLLGDGAGKFNALEPGESGFYVPGDAKSLVQIVDTDTHSATILASQNDDNLLVFRSKCRSSKYMKFQPEVSHGTLHFGNGAKRAFELYTGSGYLSCISKAIRVPASVVSVEFSDSKGNSAKHNPNK